MNHLSTPEIQIKGFPYFERNSDFVGIISGKLLIYQLVFIAVQGHFLYLLFD